MSPGADIIVTVKRVIPLQTRTVPHLSVVLAGNIGPPGPQGKWVALTQNEYDLLDPKDENTLYVIIQ